MEVTSEIRMPQDQVNGMPMMMIGLSGSSEEGSTAGPDRLKSLHASIGIRLDEPRFARHELEEQRRLEGKQRERDAARLVEFHAAVGKRYAGVTLHNFRAMCKPQWDLLEKLRDYCDQLKENIARGVGIILFGPSGTGKDHLLTAVGREVVKVGCGVLWCNGLEVFGRFRDAIAKDSLEGEIIKGLADADVLILSDPLPPSGNLSEFQAGQLWRIIDTRYRALRPTLVTLNVASGAEAEQRMGVSLVDRLRDGAICYFCNWPSHRKAMQ